MTDHGNRSRSLSRRSSHDSQRQARSADVDRRHYGGKRRRAGREVHRRVRSGSRRIAQCAAACVEHVGSYSRSLDEWAFAVQSIRQGGARADRQADHGGADFPASASPHGNSTTRRQDSAKRQDATRSCATNTQTRSLQKLMFAARSHRLFRRTNGPCGRRQAPPPAERTFRFELGLEDSDYVRYLGDSLKRPDRRRQAPRRPQAEGVGLSQSQRREYESSKRFTRAGSIGLFVETQADGECFFTSRGAL